ncbi:MAG: hypothetical protein WC897_00425 [Candidatus Gracilibacteria bacterium]
MAMVVDLIGVEAKVKETQTTDVRASVVPDGVVKTNEGIKTILADPNRTTIGDAYGYQPFPSTTERIVLGDFAKGSLITNLGENNFGQFDTLQDHGIVAISTFDTSNGGHLDLVAHKLIKIDQNTGVRSEAMHVELINPGKNEQDNGHCVCNFLIRKTDHGSYDEWDLHDRITAEAYLGQGIAPEMLHFVESQLKTRANKIEKPQIITAELAQVDVLLWLLKEGFTSATTGDSEKIDRLFSGDQDLVVVSAPMDEHAGQKRQWYVFERSKYFDENGNPKLELWDYENSEYLKQSFRIHLKKVVKS